MIGFDIISTLNALPPESPIVVTVGWLRDTLNSSREGAVAHGSLRPDLTVAEAAEIVGRKPSTVRSWCRSGQIPEAYLQQGREWRIPEQSLREFRLSQPRHAHTTRGRRSIAPRTLAGWSVEQGGGVA